LFNTEGGDPTHWGLQIISIGSGTLLNGANVISVSTVDSVSGKPPNQFDDFEFREVICHFHKDV
jgi:hypothetical protein